MLGLSELLSRRPAQLSGGQRQRVAMGRAVVRNPNVYLFDEPLSNLDAKLRVQMRSEIKMLHQRVGTTTVYVTHDQIEAMTLADKIVVLNHGRIEQQGTPLELYRRPANRFVAGFIGSPAMNFLDATIANSASGPVAVLQDGTRLGLSPASELKEGQPVIVGLRPENLVLERGGNQISGTTLVVEPTGAQTHVLFSVADTDITAVVDGAAEVSAGHQFTASISSDLIHVFDRVSGARLN